MTDPKAQAAAEKYAEGEAKAFAERNFRGMNRVYCDGLHDGYLTGYCKGYEAGQKAERERCAQLARDYGPHLVPGLEAAILNPKDSE